MSPVIAIAANAGTFIFSSCHHPVDAQSVQSHLLTAEIDWGVVIKKEQHVFLHPNTEITPWYQVDACP